MSKIRAIIIALVTWFLGSDVWPSCHDVTCGDTLFWCSCHNMMCCDIMTLIYTVNRPKNVHQSPTLLTDFGMIAEGNHFNNMIFVIRRTCRYVFKKGLHISVQKKLIKLWHNTGGIINRLLTWYEWVSLGPASTAQNLRVWPLEAGPRATHSYQVNDC